MSSRATAPSPTKTPDRTPPLAGVAYYGVLFGENTVPRASRATFPSTKEKGKVWYG